MQHTERTTVTLPRELARAVAARARKEGRSVSSLVREALERHFEQHPDDELPRFTGVGASGRRDLSERAEQVIGSAIRRRAGRK